jgi:division protein CdvB (Snf7/Vps24/ESCRT-III family)
MICTSNILHSEYGRSNQYFFEGANGLRLHAKWYRIMKKVRKVQYELDRLKEFRCLGAVKRRSTKYKRLSNLIETYLRELENINSKIEPKTDLTDSQKLKTILRKSLITTIREFSWGEKDI